MINIVPNSQAVLKAILGNKVTVISIVDCIESLREIEQDNTVEVVWILSHKGFIGNKATDSLARTGAENTRLISLQLTRKSLKNSLHDAAIKTWDLKNEARHAK